MPVSRKIHGLDPKFRESKLLGNCFSSSDFLELHGPGKVGVQTAELAFAGIAFDSEGTLYGITGDGSDQPESYFSIDKQTGALAPCLPVTHLSPILPL